MNARNNCFQRPAERRYGDDGEHALRSTRLRNIRIATTTDALRRGQIRRVKKKEQKKEKKRRRERAVAPCALDNIRMERSASREPDSVALMLVVDASPPLLEPSTKSIVGEPDR